ncbi:grass carp reovirus (GCRV)-induced gene 2o [Chiloscyllium plagiosum]|uniref:grass carp reovirus (GCRV)-induced gene 2o n=1 Tax=Chiloscyllium plagiosum TaxID=36176 RepID=UPI001CB85FE0|nr:grass carp reovirus (GCRV)-induced gene 2o [Chiloscyllium plagiosum]
MSIEFYGWQVIHEDNSHLKSGQELKNGRGYTMYHGTHKNNATSIIKSGFIPSKDGLLGAGVYVSRDVTKAKAYPKLAAASDKVVFKLKVGVGKVKKIDVDNHPLQRTWHQHGYDSAWVPPNCRMFSIPSGKEEDCIWDPKRITVVDIAYADDQVKKDLKKLIHKNAAAKTRGHCDVCGYQRDSSHVIHRCWGCEKVICSFMSKHVCKKTKTLHFCMFEQPGASGMMTLQFFGWETVHDNNHHLHSNQEPVNGREYIMYHGTSVSNARSIIQSGFKQSSKGMLGPGVYVSRDREKARRYPINTPNDRVILMLKVQVGKVKKIDKENHPMSTTWKQHGYDTAWVPPNCGMRNVPSGLEEDCVWDPQRIQVIDVINSPDPVTTQQLKDLLQANLNSKPVPGPEMVEHCQACKNTMVPSHQLQLCWGCGQTICPFMAKHICTGQERNILDHWHSETAGDQAPGQPQAGEDPMASAVQDSAQLRTYTVEPLEIKDTTSVLGSSEKQLVQFPLIVVEDLGSRFNADIPVFVGSAQNGIKVKNYHQQLPHIHRNGWVNPGLGYTLTIQVMTNNIEKRKLKLKLIKPRYASVALQNNRLRQEKIHPITMAYAYGNMWAEEDAPGFIEACLKSYEAPKNGKIYVMYHGTSIFNVDAIQRNGFCQSPKGMLGRGVYVSRDIQKACRYPLDAPDHQKVVLKLRVNVGKVKMIDYQGHPLQKTWHDHGYDTAWCPPGCGMVPSGLEEDCVWDPRRIKVVKIIHQSIQPSPLYYPDCY